MIHPMTDQRDNDHRDEADEIREAADELKAELQLAGREALGAVREAMEEARRALREARTARAGQAAAEGGEERATRSQRKELTRELLLDAAAEVFAEKGYHGASLDDVADAAGFTKGAVYSNFATKAELFLALADRHGQRRSAATAAAFRNAPLDRLPDLAEGWLRTQADEDRDWGLLTVEFWLAAVRDPEIRARLVAGRKGEMAELGAILEAKLQTSGRPAELSGRELAYVLDALGTGMLMSRYLEPDAGVEDLFARVVRTLLGQDSGPGRI
jgi:AcrR family transcriptional regulator